MTKAIMFKSSAILSTFMLILLTTPLPSASEPTPPNLRAQANSHKLAARNAEAKSHKLAARDAITLSIREVRETRKFVNDIPRLKSVQQNGQAARLLPCVEGLIWDLSFMKSTLYRLWHLKPMYLKADIISLKGMMGHGYELMNTCSESLKDMDVIVMSMLARKLDDLSMIIGDVVYHVGVIEQDVIRA